MARSAWKDILRNDSFYLLDLSLGELSFATQLIQAGFKSCTMPELTIQTQDVREGNFPIPRKIITGGGVNNITMTKGATWYDSDFWRWISRTLMGSTSGLQFGSIGMSDSKFRKDFVLMQFLKGTGIPMTFQLPGFEGGMLSGVDIFQGFHQQADSGKVSLVPVKMWLLKNALPLRYKPGTDFDAQSPAVSIGELEIVYEYFDEISVGNSI
jgi:phage tail-like protein